MTATATAAMNENTLRLRVLDAIKEIAGKPFTVQDVVARTGLPPYQAESELTKVVKDYTSDLDVDESGNLVYRFDPSLTARPDIVKADASRRRKEAFRNGLIAFFKAWTVAMVIVYFVIYITLLIAFFVALSKARGDNDDRRSSGWGGGGGFWLTWGSPFGYGGYGTHTSRRRRHEWNRETERQLEQGKDPYRFDKSEEPKKPSLSERTWYHLFGAQGIKRNPLEHEKELLTYIRAKKGFITNADIVALLGVTYDEADAIGTRLVATYDGELDLTDEAIAIYRFPNLMLTGAPEVADQVAQLGYLWHVRQKEEMLRRHPSKVVPVLNVVNIILALVTAGIIIPYFQWQGLGTYIGLVFFPLTFSGIFLFLGMRRKMRELAGKADYERDSMRIAIFRLLFTRRTAVKLPGDERTLASLGFGEFESDKWKAAAPAISEAIRGEVTDVGARLEIRADRIWQELATVEKLRAQSKSDRRVGRTVFTTRDIAGASPIGEVGDTVVQGGKAPQDQALADEIAKLEKELQS
jgi:hypothetical protein